MHVSNTAAIAEADAITALLDSGSAALCRIYDGTGGIPADNDVAISTQVLLVEITLNDPSFPGATDDTPGALLTLDVTPIPEANAVASANAAFARLTTSAGVSHVQLDTVTVTGGGGELEINSIAITSGVAVQITGGTILIPEN